MCRMTTGSRIDFPSRTLGKLSTCGQRRNCTIWLRWQKVESGQYLATRWIRIRLEICIAYRVPEIVVLKKHVLIMSFIGREGKPAPKLKDAADQMSAKDLEIAYNQVVEMMEQLYTVCHLVHADLSEYNILWYEKEVWFIDVSQAVEPIHPSGLDFLLRDCTNVCNVGNVYI